MPAIKLLASLIVLTLLSLTVKYMRYSAPMPDEYSVSQVIETKLSAVGWQMAYRAPMNTNRTSILMALEKEGCPQKLYLSVIGSDASNVGIFKDYTGQRQVRYLLADSSPENYVYLRFYLRYLMDRVEGFLWQDKRVYSPLLALYNPYETEHCSVVAALTSKGIGLVVERY